MSNRSSSLADRDRPVDIVTDLTRRADLIRPTGDLVLIETNSNDSKVGSLWIPMQAMSHYPTSGWVMALGPKVSEDLAVGDFVLVEEEGTDVEQSYYDVFEVVLRMPDGDLESIWVDIETEPIVREHVALFRRGAKPDNLITVKDAKDGGGIRFNCSDVVDFQMGEMANPSYDLTYVPTSMFYFLNEDNEPTLFYMMSERKILCTMEY